MTFDGKKVLVTGASSGIGQAIAVAFARRGAYVYINYRNNEMGANETLRMVQEHATGEIVQADLSQKEEVKKLFETIGEISVLINNAGEAEEGDLFNDDIWEHQHNSIFRTALYCLQEFLAHPPKEKKIVNVTSMYGNFDTGNPNLIAYSAYKAALNSLTKNVAKASTKDVQVNAVAPGYTWTPAWEGISEEEKEKRAQLANIERWVEPAEIARVVVALAENDAIHGEIVTVDGGVSLVKGL